jgi:hypothetical protein
MTDAVRFSTASPDDRCGIALFECVGSGRFHVMLTSPLVGRWRTRALDHGSLAAIAVEPVSPTEFFFESRLNGQPAHVHFFATTVQS